MDLSPNAITLLLRLHDAATGRRSNRKASTLDQVAVDELRDAGLAVKIPVGVCLTPAGVDRARRLKGDVPVPLAMCVDDGVGGGL